jgi:hypothetical protein
MALSPQEFERLKIQLQKQQSPGLKAPSPQGPGILQGIKQDFSARTGKAADAQLSALSGNQTDKSAALQTLGQGAGFVGDVASRLIPDAIEETIGKGITKASEYVPKSIADIGGDAILKYQGWKEQHPEAAANIESIGSLGTLVPIGAIAKTGAQTGVKAALVGTGKAIEVGADAISTPGKVIRGAGSALYKTAITPTVKEAEQILKYRAKTPFLTRVSSTLDNTATPPLTRGQTALEKGLMGTESAIGVQAKRSADNLWNKEIAPAVAKSKVQMTKDELFTPALERIAATEDPTRKAALQNAYEALLEDYKAYPDSFDLTKAQKLKVGIAKFTPTKIFKGQDVASELRTLQADMASAIRTKTYEALADEGIKKKYLDWANLDELQSVGVKAISEASFKAGSGTLLSGLWDMATTPIKTIGGQVLYRVGSKLEFQGAKGIKTFGQYLKQKGYEKPTEYNLPKSEPGIGLSVKDISVTPESVAKKIDMTDVRKIARFLDNPETADIDDLLKLMKIDKAPRSTQVKFLIEVLDLTNF